MNTLTEELAGREELAASSNDRMKARDEKFFPSGGIAFFIALVILCLVIWFGIYFLMIERV